VPQPSVEPATGRSAARAARVGLTENKSMSRSTSGPTAREFDFDASRSRIDRAEAEYRRALAQDGRDSSAALFAYQQWMNLRKLHSYGLTAQERNRD
jgi:hypothetical protein